MGELTTEQALGFIADELCERSVGYNEDHSKGCPARAIAQEWLAQVQREAKIEELRRLAQEIAKAPITVLAIYSEADGAYVDGMGNARKAIVKAIQDRADRMEAA